MTSLQVSILWWIFSGSLCMSLVYICGNWYLRRRHQPTLNLIIGVGLFLIGVLTTGLLMALLGQFKGTWFDDPRVLGAAVVSAALAALTVIGNLPRTKSKI